jgi:hypothetical protein
VLRQGTQAVRARLALTLFELCDVLLGDLDALGKLVLRQTQPLPRGANAPTTDVCFGHAFPQRIEQE